MGKKGKGKKPTTTASDPGTQTPGQQQAATPAGRGREQLQETASGGRGRGQSQQSAPATVGVQAQPATVQQREPERALEQKPAAGTSAQPISRSADESLPQQWLVKKKGKGKHQPTSVIEQPKIQASVPSQPAVDKPRSQQQVLQQPSQRTAWQGAAGSGRHSGQVQQQQQQLQQQQPPQQTAWRGKTGAGHHGEQVQQQQEQLQQQPKQPTQQTAWQEAAGAGRHGEQVQQQQQLQQQPKQPSQQTAWQGAADAGRHREEVQQQQQQQQPLQPPQQTAWRGKTGAGHHGEQGQQQQQLQQQPKEPSQQTAWRGAAGAGRGDGAWGAGRGQSRGVGRGQPQQPAGRGVGRGRGQPGRVESAPGRVHQAPSSSSSSQQHGLQHLGSGEQRPSPPQQASASSTVCIPAGAGEKRRRGTRGKPCTVSVNMLELYFNKLETAFHYDVAITPDMPKRMMRPVWEAFFNKCLSQYKFAFDNKKNAYSPTRLPDDISGEVSLAEDADSQPRQYRVVMRLAAEVNLRALFTFMQSGCSTPGVQDALQCIDIVLRNALALRYVRVARSCFTPPQGEVVSLGDGLELWHGFFQSAIIGWRPFLNVDVAHKGFTKLQSVVDLIDEMTNGRRLNDNHVKKINRFIRDLKVQYELPGLPSSRRKQRVNALAQPPKDAWFELEDGSKSNVFDFFKREKRYNIKHPNLPCLWVGARDRKTKVLLPPELCTLIPGQPFNRQLNDIQTRKMVAEASTSTTVRKDKIMQSVNSINFNNNETLQDFGISVGTEFMEVTARVLPPPLLQYSGSVAKPTRGQWFTNKFLEAKELRSWTIISLDYSVKDDALNNFVRLLKMEASKLGMTVLDPEYPFQHLNRIESCNFNQLKNKEIIFFVIPGRSNLYSQVKQKAELDVGCLTQCIKSDTILKKMNSKTANQILQKVNTKLNGQNHLIAENPNNYRPACLQQPCMILGADVTHPSPDQSDIPSVAAVTASCDPGAFKYSFRWRLQHREIIEDLENIVKDLLITFYKKSNQKPQRLIFFRDGVSETQFQEVMNMEVQAIRRACSALGTPGTYKPPITFLVVQKRHHTRLFPTSPADSDDSGTNLNVRAGTVVDTVITHHSNQVVEYYLVSHASPRGVARPTKYRVLWDDADMSEDELEAMTYYLCHMFSRCTRSVSYPAPTYYAHLAAFRARVYLEGHQLNLGNLPQEQKRHQIEEEFVRNQPMFFV